MTGRSIGFTATRNLDYGGRQIALNVLVTKVPSAARYITGGAAGGDAFIGEWLYMNRRDAGHVIIVPANRTQVDPWWEKYDGARLTVIEMPPGTTYADRNARIVAESDAVFGLPAYPEGDPRSRRSGTWQTIRMARRAGKLSQWYCVTPPYRGHVERLGVHGIADLRETGETDVPAQ